jgi:8-oxo-dGTP diphosphatase
LDSYVKRLRQLVGTRVILIPGARVVIENKLGQVLLQHRADFGIWGIPGGSAEEGETISEVIVREVWEETGLQLLSLSPFGYASDPAFEFIEFPNGDVAHFHVVNFYSREFSGELTLNNESYDLQWFYPSELPVMLPNMKNSIENYLQFKEDNIFKLF